MANGLAAEAPVVALRSETQMMARGWCLVIASPIGSQWGRLLFLSNPVTRVKLIMINLPLLALSKLMPRRGGIERQMDVPDARAVAAMPKRSMTGCAQW